MPAVLAAAVSILMEYLKTGTRFYRDYPRTYTYCQEEGRKNWQLSIGGFGLAGLEVLNFNSTSYVNDNHGVGALRKF